jgi:hypothetical protein
MKKYLFAGAGALALAMAATVVQAEETTGYVGGNYSNIDIGSGSATQFGVEGNAGFAVSDTFELQVDGSIASINPDGPGGSSTVWGGTGHAFYDTDTYKVGAFAGYQDIGDVFGSDGNVFGYGIEGRFAVGESVTLGAVAGWGSINIDGAPDIDLSAYRGEASFFASDNLRFDVSYTKTNADWGPFSGDATVWAVGGEWQMADNPISFTAGYSSSSGRSSGGDVTTWSVGVRRTFGGSLKDRDRNSSPFTGLPFSFGGLGGLVSSAISAADDAFHCLALEDNCPDNDDAINSWLDGFDEGEAEFILCGLFECDDED